MNCSREQCVKPARVKGMCKTHYNQTLPNRHRPRATVCVVCGKGIARSSGGGGRRPSLPVSVTGAASPTVAHTLARHTARHDASSVSRDNAGMLATWVHRASTGGVTSWPCG